MPGDQAARAVGHRDAEGLALTKPVEDSTSQRGTMPSCSAARSPDVEVVEEAVEGRDPLDQAALEVGPLLGRDDARHEVHREGPLEPSSSP